MHVGTHIPPFTIYTHFRWAWRHEYGRYEYESSNTQTSDIMRPTLVGPALVLVHIANWYSIKWNQSNVNRLSRVGFYKVGIVLMNSIVYSRVLPVICLSNAGSQPDEPNLCNATLIQWTIAECVLFVEIFIIEAEYGSQIESALTFELEKYIPDTIESNETVWRRSRLQHKRTNEHGATCDTSLWVRACASRWIYVKQYSNNNVAEASSYFYCANQLKTM